MTAPATWHTIDMRWRLVRAGDVVLDPGGNPWMVVAVQPPIVIMQHGRDEIRRERDPDATVPVLVRSDVVAAVEIAARELGPVRVLDRVDLRSVGPVHGVGTGHVERG